MKLFLLPLAATAALFSGNVVLGRSLMATASASSSASSNAVATNGGTAVSNAQSTANAAAVGSGSATANSAAQSTAVASGAGSLSVSNANSQAVATAGSGESNDASALANSLSQALGVQTSAYSNAQTLAQALSQKVDLPFYVVTPTDPAEAPQVQAATASAPSDSSQQVPLGLLNIIQFLQQVQGQVQGQGQTTCPDGYTAASLAGVPVCIKTDVNQDKCVAAFDNLCGSIVDQVKQQLGMSS